jgi:hypothetical protein
VTPGAATIQRAHDVDLADPRSATGLARDLLEEGGERLLTEMSDEELMSVVALDIHKACAA